MRLAAVICICIGIKPCGKRLDRPCPEHTAVSVMLLYYAKSNKLDSVVPVKSYPPAVWKISERERVNESWMGWANEMSSGMNQRWRINAKFFEVLDRYNLRNELTGRLTFNSMMPWQIPCCMP